MLEAIVGDAQKEGRGFRLACVSVSPKSTIFGKNVSNSFRRLSSHPAADGSGSLQVAGSVPPWNSMAVCLTFRISQRSLE